MLHAVRGRLVLWAGSSSLVHCVFWEVWPGLWVLCGGKEMIVISVSSLSFGTRTCKLKLVISIASSNGGRPCSMPGSEGVASSGDTLSGPALSFYLVTGLSRDRQLGLGSGVILRNEDREDRMPRERDDYGSTSLLIGTT